jgi:hypothetical protein
MPRTPFGQKSARNLSRSQNDDERGMLDLPQFDSLPAAAGLNNTEAFQLSIKHALALLPKVFAENFITRSDNAERFSLR